MTTLRKKNPKVIEGLKKCKEKGYIGITYREYEVLELITHGFSTEQAAEKLFIEECTLKTHVHNLLEKLCVSTRIRLILKALVEELVVLDNDQLVYKG